MYDNQYMMNILMNSFQEADIVAIPHFKFKSINGVEMTQILSSKPPYIYQWLPELKTRYLDCSYQIFLSYNKWIWVLINLSLILIATLIFYHRINFGRDKVRSVREKAKQFFATLFHVYLTIIDRTSFENLDFKLFPLVCVLLFSMFTLSRLAQDYIGTNLVSQNHIIYEHFEQLLNADTNDIELIVDPRSPSMNFFKDEDTKLIPDIYKKFYKEENLIPGIFKHIIQ